jgi:hypothetical protein
MSGYGLNRKETFIVPEGKRLVIRHWNTLVYAGTPTCEILLHVHGILMGYLLVTGQSVSSPNSPPVVLPPSNRALYRIEPATACHCVRLLFASGLQRGSEDAVTRTRLTEQPVLGSGVGPATAPGKCK